MNPLTREQETSAGLLRIAIVLDSYNVSAWIASALEDLLHADFLNIAAVILVPEQKTPANRDWRNWVFRKYAAWDGRPEPADDPLRLVDMSSRLNGVSSGISLEALASFDLDALLWLSASRPEANLRKLARYGVWRPGEAAAAHFWEIYKREPVTRSLLEVLREGADSPQIVCETYTATVQGWSWRQNRKGPYWRASTFLLRCLRQLHDEKEQGAPPAAPPLRDGNRTAAADKLPTNWQMAGFFLRNAARTLDRRIRYAHKESHWFVAYRTDRNHFVATNKDFHLHGFKKIEAPEGHFYADPFVMPWRGRQYLFVEDYLFAQRRGCISVMELGANGVITQAERVLDLPYHLSYPFVFEHEGDLYMIPETLGAGRIELYRALAAPLRWELVKVLKDNVQAVDTTLWSENGVFYFFTNIAGRGATVNDDLYLFSADSLVGEWKAHPKNPIVSDVRRSRGAGKLFRRGHSLIRPAQDCSLRYGYACQLNEIEVLTPSQYRERPLRRIEPDWAPGLIGTHTINSDENFEVIDGQVYGRRYKDP